MAGRVIYRYTRVRAIGFATVSQDTAADRAYYQTELVAELRNLESEYDTLMYGGTAITQVGGWVGG